jgi:hypothetical protein
MKLVFVIFYFIFFCALLTFGQSDSLNYIAVPDSFPHFIYGDNSYSTFIQRNMNYPPEARTKAIQGKVYISLIIDTLGNVLSTSILKDIGEGCGQEAKRLLQSTSGMWAPGIYQNKKVNVKLNLPIQFTCLNCTPTEGTSFFIPAKKPPAYYYDLGFQEFHYGHFLIAIYYFNRSIELNAKDDQSLYYRGLSKVETNDKSGACIDFHAASLLGNLEAKNNLAKYCP